jgi:hypothetical protein
MGLDKAHLDRPRARSEAGTTNAAWERISTGFDRCDATAEKLTAAMDEDVDALEGIPLGNERHLGIKELKRDGGETIRHRQAGRVSGCRGRGITG